MKLTVRRIRPPIAALLAIAALWACQSTASAVFVSSTADAYGVSSTLTSTPVTGGPTVSATILPLYEATSNNPPGSNNTTGPAAFSFPGTLLSVTAGTVTDTATTIPAPTATGTSDIANLFVITAGPLSFAATAIHTTSTVTGDVGAFIASGSTTFTGLNLVVNGVAFNIASPPAPNTTVNLASAGIANATLILNEQILSGDGNTSRGITTNAFHLRYGVGGATTVGGQTIAGDLILGHTSALVNAAGAVP